MVRKIIDLMIGQRVLRSKNEEVQTGYHLCCYERSRLTRATVRNGGFAERENLFLAHNVIFPGMTLSFHDIIQKKQSHLMSFYF